jgi:tetratricopeptide (TPR) repeat protein
MAREARRHAPGTDPAPAARPARLALGVGALTALAFLPALRAGFVDWDDTTLLVGNEAYRGFGRAQLAWMFTTVLLGHYAPIKWLSWAADHALWGLDPFGYHLTSLVVHAANASLTCVVAGRLLGAAGLPARAGALGAAAAALFFGVHPLRVETVAWVAERGGVLAGLFVLLALLAYLEAARRGAAWRRWLAASVVAYALALGSKGSALALPVVLGLVDVYPLRRLPGDPRQWHVAGLRGLWLEKVPYLLVAALGALAAYGGKARGATTGAVPLDGGTWIALVIETLWFHVYRTLLPLDLSPLYELPSREALFGVGLLVSGAGLAGLTLVAIACRRPAPAALAAWVYYVAMLAPVMGWLHAGRQLTADRYGYLPSLGLAVLAGGALAALVDRTRPGSGRPALGRAALAAALVWGLGQGVLTWRQTEIWQDNGRLWAHAVAATPDCALCRTNLGLELLRRGDPAAALGQLRTVLALNPSAAATHGEVARAFAALGRFAEAIPHYERMLAALPQRFDARVGLASALVATGRLAGAVEEVRTALRLQRTGEVTAYFEWALRANPDAVVIRLGLIEIHRAAGRDDLAAGHIDALRSLNPALVLELAAARAHGS